MAADPFVEGIEEAASTIGRIRDSETRFSKKERR